MEMFGEFDHGLLDLMIASSLAIHLVTRAFTYEKNLNKIFKMGHHIFFVTSEEINGVI